MNNENEPIADLNLSLVESTESTLSVEFTGNALTEIKGLKQILKFDSDKQVVNFAVALLAKAKKETATIQIRDKNNNVTYNLEF